MAVAGEQSCFPGEMEGLDVDDLATRVEAVDHSSDDAGECASRRFGTPAGGGPVTVNDDADLSPFVSVTRASSSVISVTTA